MTMTDPQPTAYLARIRAWRYEGADAIEVLDAPQGPLVLRDWHTPVFHLADGSTTVTEVLETLTRPSPSGATPPADAADAVRAVIRDLIDLGVLEARERAGSLDPAHDLSVDGEV